MVRARAAGEWEGVGEPDLKKWRWARSAVDIEEEVWMKRKGWGNQEVIKARRCEGGCERWPGSSLSEQQQPLSSSRSRSKVAMTTAAWLSQCTVRVPIESECECSLSRVTGRHTGSRREMRNHRPDTLESQHQNHMPAQPASENLSPCPCPRISSLFGLCSRATALYFSSSSCENSRQLSLALIL